MILAVILAQNTQQTGNYWQTSFCSGKNIKGALSFIPGLKNEGKYEEAKDLILFEIETCKSEKTSKEKQKTLSNLYSELSELEYFFGHYQLSLENSEKSLAQDKNNLKAFYYKGKALSKLNRKQEAINFIEPRIFGFLVTNKEHPELNNYKSKIFDILGTAHYFLKNYSQAEHWENLAIETNPQNQVARYNLATIYLNNKTENWRTYYSKSIGFFNSVDQKMLAEQRAETSYERKIILNIGKELEKKLGANINDIKLLSETILAFEQTKIPEVTNAYLQYFIKYVPDDINNDNILSAKEFVSLKTGDCDDYAAFINLIFTSANIRHRPVKQKIDIGPIHIKTEFKLNGESFYIDQSGIQKAD